MPPDLKFQMWLQFEMAEQWQPATPHCAFLQIKILATIKSLLDDYNPQRVRQALMELSWFQAGQMTFHCLALIQLLMNTRASERMGKNEADYSGGYCPKTLVDKLKVRLAQLKNF